MPPRRPPSRLPDGRPEPKTHIPRNQQPRDGDEEDRDEAPAGTRGSYRTGNEYPAEDDDRLAGGDDDDQPLDSDGRDIYGEDEPLPDDAEAHTDERRNDANDDNPEATRAGPPRKLVIIAGPDKGKVKKFAGVRMVVGRTSACNIHLADSSVSRRHLELVQGSSGVMMRDLGSGNGTKVNGERINEKVLKHEDVIEIGQTKLQYIDEVEAVRLAREEAERKEEEARRAKEEAQKKEEEAAAAAKSAESSAVAAAESSGMAAAESSGVAKAPGEGESGIATAQADAPGKGAVGAFKSMSLTQRIAVGAGSAFMLLVFFILISLIFRSPDVETKSPKQLAAEKKMDGARVAMNEEKFVEAVELLESAERMVPGIDADNLLVHARVEVEAHKALDTARAALDGEKFEDCRTALAQIPEEISQRTRDAKKKIEDELDGKMMGYLEKKVDEALAEYDLDKARTILSQLPEDRQKAYGVRIALVEKDAKSHLQQVAAQQAAEASQGRKRAAVAKQAQLDAAFRAVERKFNAEEYDRATLECDRVVDGSNDAEVHRRANALKKLIPSFARSWDDGKKKHAAKALESAVRPLQKAWDLYNEIALPGMLGAQVEERLLESANAGGKAALIRNDMGTAASLYRLALSLAPGDPTAKEGLSRIAQRAEDLYMEAYMIRDRDPKESMAKYKLVLEVAPKGSAAYEKARAQLALMSP